MKSEEFAAAVAMRGGLNAKTQRRKGFAAVDFSFLTPLISLRQQILPSSLFPLHLKESRQQILHSSLFILH